MLRRGSQLKRLLVIGPATVVAVAYIDPGNFGANIQAGSKYGLSLLWVVWLSGAMAVMFQYISGKIGIVSGAGLTDIAMGQMKRRRMKLLYFIGLFIAILATDMAEFIGMAVGLHLLFKIPLTASAFLSVVDVLILFFLTEDLGKMEVLIAGLVGVVGLSYLVELAIVHASPMEIAMHSFVPSLKGGAMALTAVSIIGATVMPHAVILHSYLSAERLVREGWERDRELKHHLKETVINLGGASLVNAAIQIMSYYAYYKNGLNDIVSLDNAYYTLIPFFGSVASTIFAVALFASGLSSSMVSVLAGVKIVESYFGAPTKQWKVRLTLRLINMVPFLIAVYAGFSTMELLVYTQAILSFTLPLVLFPLTFIGRSEGIMGERKIGRALFYLSLISSIFILLINFAIPFYG
ncbi:MAG: Nramp family divalent metal transporter [Fervidicoccaceae archaeon]